MKKVIRLTENDIHRIVKNSVKRVLKEMSEPTRKFYMSNGYATSKVFEATYEEAILKCLKEVNAMSTSWLYELGKGEVGRTRKINAYKGDAFYSNEDGKVYVEINDRLVCINDK